MEINGLAHVMLTVSNFEACAPFYRKLLTFLGMKPVIDGDGALYCVGGRTAMGIMRAEEKFSDERFEQFRVGLHHV
jgi:catechol 2,3-dioxygenase-like lactoylglutathione lyase family enzyme